MFQNFRYCPNEVCFKIKRGDVDKMGKTGFKHSEEVCRNP